MAETQINNTQEVVGNFAADVAGAPLTIASLVGTVVSGAGSFDNATDSTGAPLPPNQMAFLSAPGTTGVTEYAVVVNYTDPAVTPQTAQVLLTVIEGTVNLSITFSAPVPRRSSTPPTAAPK